MIKNRKKLIYWAPLALAGLAAFIAAGGEIVKLLWNGLLPPLFGWHAVTFWQALGMLALCRILFGGFGFHGGDGQGWHRRKDQRWNAMTPEERERFRQGIRADCGGTGEPGCGSANPA